MPATILDIAAKAQLNPSTVSRALRNDSRIRPNTVARIQRIARELNYMPNRAARQLTTGKTGLVALCTGMLDYEYLTPVALALSQELEKHDYLLTVLPNTHGDRNFLRMMNLLSQRFCDAAVLFSPHIQPDNLPELKQLQDRHFPLVCIDQWLANYPFPGVTNNAEESIRLLGERMCQHNINAAALYFPAENTTSLFRRRSATQFLQDKGIPFVTTLEEIPALLQKHPHANFGFFADNPAQHPLDQYLRENPPACCIGGMFDSWKFDAPKCYTAIYLCIQDAFAHGLAAGKYILQMLEGKADDIPPVTYIPPREIIVPRLGDFHEKH